MRTEVLSSPFPPVALLDHDKRVMLDAVDLLLQDALAQYEAHLIEDRGIVSARQWKLVKTRDGILVHRKRRTTPRASDSSKVHTILAVGSVDGSVDDFLLGFVNPTAEGSTAYTQYIFKGSASGAATLATIVKPSRKAPDRTVSIKWEAHGALYPLNKMFATRDFVTAEVTGTTINSMGERIAYHLLHSVDVAGAPELRERKYIRATKYFAFLYRQSSPQQVDVFVTGRVDPRGDVPTGITTHASADGLANIILRTKRYSDIKKRTWWLRYHDTVLQTQGSTRDVYAAAPPGGCCSVCSKSIGGVLSALSKTCSACSRRVCSSSSCGASKKVIHSREWSGASLSHSSGSTNSSDRPEFAMRKVAFCAHCLAAAHHLNAWELAANDAASMVDMPSDSEEGSDRGLPSVRRRIA
jgi:hypothetical protein